VVKKINELRAGAHGPLEMELKAIDKALADVTDKRNKWYKLYENEHHEPEVVRTRLNQLQVEVAQLTKRQVEVTAKIASLNVTPVSRDVVHASLLQFEHLLRHAPPPEQKVVLQLLVTNIQIKDRAVTSLEIHRPLTIVL
jgi:site-specific DNA recombinase